MATRRVHVIVEGRVQGVFFRAYTEEQANSLGLAGWVRNRADGKVECLLEGEADAVERMLAWFAQGSPGSRVTNVIAREEEPVGERAGFEIHY